MQSKVGAWIVDCFYMTELHGSDFHEKYKLYTVKCRALVIKLAFVKVTLKLDWQSPSYTKCIKFFILQS